MEYYQYENDDAIPARWDNAGKGVPQIWSNGWVTGVDPFKWAMHATKISKAEFDKLCAQFGAKQDDPVKPYGSR
ncbi:hypothetical protein [Polaromonas sp. C04]|uniref:hypothetical protein n=1 Tax=Polaromonas sp. C04 TaxID=1945857 RepID=UPI0009846BF0|nr:hypothetical protein [Polaromonas sp. C04]OOG58905.1 hypothetical protein B0E49_03145 [Polaromonas sp. C04]